MKIITLTLNPAFDIHCNVKGLALRRENLASITDYEAGGKGVNISRALKAGGVESLALVVLGEENGDSFTKLLDKDGITYKPLTVSGRIRENITLHDGTAETRISFEGSEADSSLLFDVQELLRAESLDGTFITLTGRIPSGIDISSVKKFAKDLTQKGAKLVIDSRSFSLDDIIEVRPYLIKPNQEEISEYLGRDIKDFSEVREAAETLHSRGIENVMISLGEDGALLVSDEGTYVARPPRIDAISTIGAGDSSVGGFLAAAVEKKGSRDTLRLAVAYGTAACMTEGTRPPRSEDIQSVYDHVTVESF